jgi:hypothetical protein
VWEGSLVVGIWIHYHGDGLELEEENWEEKNLKGKNKVFLFVKKRVGEFWL